MSDFNEAYNINVCKDKCDFVLTTVEYTPNGYSYYKCSKCENTLKKKSATNDTSFLQSEITQRR